MNTPNAKTLIAPFPTTSATADPNGISQRRVRTSPVVFRPRITTAAGQAVTSPPQLADQTHLTAPPEATRRLLLRIRAARALGRTIPHVSRLAQSPERCTCIRETIRFAASRRRFVGSRAGANRGIDY